MAPDGGRPAAAGADRGLDDGVRAVRLTVLVVLLLDALTTPIGQAFGVADLGRTDLLAEVQRGLLVAAAVATMWHRPRIAVVLTALVVALFLAAGPTGEELWLLMITGVSAAIRASRWQLSLVVLAQVGYAWGFGWKLNQTYPGQGWAAGVFIMGFAGSALVIGLVVRWLLRSRDRRRQRVQALHAAQTKMRTIERARLADELQSVVSLGLGSIDEELDELTRGPADLDTLRSGLARVDRRCRALLDQLRTLLGVLRLGPGPDPDPRPSARAAGPGRWVDLATARHVRIAATAVFALLAVRAAIGHLGAPPDIELAVLVSGLLAWAAAVWRPIAAAIAAAALMIGSAVAHGALHGSAGYPTAGYGDLLSTTLLCLIAAMGLRPRACWLGVCAVVGYAGVLAVTETPDPADHVLYVGLCGFLAIAGGFTARHLISARRHALDQLVALAEQGERMESEERSAVARELHDVVAHSLSVTTMLVMATSLSDDPAQLTDTVKKIGSSTEAAHRELHTLLQAMRGPDPDPEPAVLVPPLATASALADRLRENGFRVDVEVDAAANAVDPTTQRTLTRIMQESTTNILRYTPVGATCHVALTVGDSVTRLRILSPLAVTERRSGLSLGWGLGGIRERVELTQGLFSAGPDRDRWVVDVTLPTAPATMERLVH